MEILLHTPEGVRDIYNSECERKSRLTKRLLHTMHHYGFQDIQTPSFEFFDVFSKQRGTVPSKDMYKFFDREGNTLVLRPDMTPPIARCAAKYFKDETLPIRLCYHGSVFINNESLQGKLKEFTQIGAELIEDASIEADVEMIALTIDCLKQAVLKEFQVEVGEADFFRGLVEEAGFREDEIEALRLLIEDKNIFGVEEMVSEKTLNPLLKEPLLRMPELFGSVQMLKDAKRLTGNQRAQRAICQLEQIYERMKVYGYENYLTFDLGMLGKYNYYTGIIFRAYTYGTGEAVAAGGRYDNLVGQFGKDAPAIGVCIYADQLLNAMERQKLEEPVNTDRTLLVYQDAAYETAVKLASGFRRDGMDIALLKEDDGHTVSDYLEYARRNHIGGILHLTGGDTVEVIEAASGKVTRAGFREMFAQGEKA